MAQLRMGDQICCKTSCKKRQYCNCRRKRRQEISLPDPHPGHRRVSAHERHVRAENKQAVAIKIACCHREADGQHRLLVFPFQYGSFQFGDAHLLHFLRKVVKIETNTLATSSSNSLKLDCGNCSRCLVFAFSPPTLNADRVLLTWMIHRSSD